MSYDGDMRPKDGDEIIRLPITFDYSGGRRDSDRMKYIWSGITGAVGSIISIGLLTSSKGSIFTNVVFGSTFFCGVVGFIRFGLLKEHRYRNSYVKMIDNDYMEDVKSIWGIYSIDNEYPYYARLKNGYSACYIMFEKDVVVGKPESAIFDHYEAIGDAYKLAGMKNIQMAHIDYMDSIGSDDRIDYCYESLKDVDNSDIEYLLRSMYANIQNDMNSSVATFDIYVFVFKFSDRSFWYELQKIINCLLEANYMSYRVLDQNDLRDVTKSLFNLDDFSIVEATSQVFTTSRKAGVVPISLTDEDGKVTIINKTTEQKAEERRLKEESARLEKEELRRRRELEKERKKNPNIIEDDEEDLDIF